MGLHFNLEKKNFSDIFRNRTKVCYDNVGLKVDFYQLSSEPENGVERAPKKKLLEELVIIKRSGNHAAGKDGLKEAKLAKLTANYTHVKMVDIEKQSKIRDESNMMDELSGKNKKNKNKPV